MMERRLPSLAEWLEQYPVDVTTQVTRYGVDVLVRWSTPELDRDDELRNSLRHVESTTCYGTPLLELRLAFFAWLMRRRAERDVVRTLKQLNGYFRTRELLE